MDQARASFSSTEKVAADGLAQGNEALAGPRSVGRQFFASPGPTNMPDSVLAAVAHVATDVNDPGFRRAYAHCVGGLKQLLQTRHRIMMYTASGHGAWEATLVNLFSPGDMLLMLDSGFHSEDWVRMAERLGLSIQVVAADRRHGFDMRRLEDALRGDVSRRIRAVCVVHSETATGVVTDPVAVRTILDRMKHPALFILDAVSSIGCMEVRMDEWGVDALIGSGQKGLMLPVGLSFTAVSERALDMHRRAALPRCYFDWTAMLERPLESFCGTAPNGMLFGLCQALILMEEENLSRLYERHRQLGRAVRAAVHAWSIDGGPQVFCRDEACASDAVTTVLMPRGYDAEPLRALARSRFNVLVAGGLGDLWGKSFRIGHMGDLNEPMILGTLACIEMSLDLSKVPHTGGGVRAAMSVLGCN